MILMEGLEKSLPQEAELAGQIMINDIVIRYRQTHLVALN